MPLGEIKERADPVTCRSVGWLVHRSKAATSLASSLTESDKAGCMEMVIPNVAIKKITVLRK